MKKLTYRFLIVMAASLGFWACEDEDNHFGDPTVQASAPSITIAVPTTNATFIEKDTTFEFTVTMSTAQLVDVYVYLSKVSGTASAGDDYSFDNRIIIPANRTSAKGVIKLIADTENEETETLKVQIGDARTANASITPVTMEFTVMNVSEDDLALELSWAVDYFDASGSPLGPTEAADMILFITEPDGTVVEAVDGAAFESFVVNDDLADGDYLIKTGVYAAINPGALGSPPVLDIILTYSQLGEISPTTIEFKEAFDTKLVCDGNLFTIASLEKSGSSYSIEEIGEAAFVDVASFVSAFDCDEPGYGVYEVNFTLGTGPGQIVNDNFWDSGFSITYVLDVCGTVTIPTQVRSIGATPFRITGSGTYDPATYEMVVNYKVVNNTTPTTVYDVNVHTFTIK